MRESSIHTRSKCWPTSSRRLTGFTERIAKLRGDEPWPGYDQPTAAEIKAVLDEGDEERG
jgi:hypothetical protein